MREKGLGTPTVAVVPVHVHLCTYIYIYVYIQCVCVCLFVCNMQQPAETPSPILYKHQKMRDEDLGDRPKRIKLDAAEEGKVKAGVVCVQKRVGGWAGGGCVRRRDK